MKQKRRQLERHHAANVEAARIILADRLRYAGVLQEWARLVLQTPTDTSPESNVRQPVGADQWI